MPPRAAFTCLLRGACRARTAVGQGSTSLSVDWRNSMRKMTFAAVVLFALVATSYAVAHGIEGAKSAKSVAATFTATGSTTSTRTCTTTDGKTIVITDGKYTGAAAGDPDLTGTITLRARSVINTTDNVGTVDGRLAID